MNTRPWETQPIIGKATTKKLRLNPNTKKTFGGETYSVVDIISINGHKAYVTNKSYEPGRKNEPLIIMQSLAKKYTKKRSKK